MLCTDADFCIWQSYHPETNSSKCFLVQQSYTLMQVIKEVIDSIYHNNKMLEWNHFEIKKLRNFGENVIGKLPGFELLKPLRAYIKKLSNVVPVVNFVDQIDFTLGDISFL